MALQEANAPASIALWVTGARKPPLHGEAVVLEEDTVLHILIQVFIKVKGKAIPLTGREGP
jgi:hypothetical protein